MEFVLSSRYGAAIAAFAAVALAVLAFSLFWEGIRGFLRRRSVERELKRLSERSKPGAIPSGDPISLLRDEAAPLPEWLAPFANYVPRLSDIQLMLEQARSSWSAGTFVLLTVGLSLGFGTVAGVLTGTLLFALLAAAIGALIPYFLVVRQRNKRLRQFEEQFPDAVDLLARSARAGHALQTGLREVGDESPDPTGEEFRQVFEEQKFGLPLAESLLGLSDRIDLVDVRMFVTSVLIQKETGGNLAENMDNLGHIIRERFRFQRQIKVHTAHGRMTGTVLALAPIFTGALLLLVNPDYMTPMFTEPLGRAMLGATGALQFVGFMVIRRMTALEF